MYVCSHCGNYKSFSVSIPETVTNSLERTKDAYEEQLLYVKDDCAMQDIEDTLVCCECNGMGVVDVRSEHLDIELQNELWESLKMGVLNKPLMEKMKKEALSV